MPEKRPLVTIQRCQNCRWYTPARDIAEGAEPYGECYLRPPRPWTGQGNEVRPMVYWRDRCAEWDQFRVEHREYASMPKGVRA